MKSEGKEDVTETTNCSWYLFFLYSIIIKILAGYVAGHGKD